MDRVDYFQLSLKRDDVSFLPRFGQQIKMNSRPSIIEPLCEIITITTFIFIILSSTVNFNKHSKQLTIFFIRRITVLNTSNLYRLSLFKRLVYTKKLYVYKTLNVSGTLMYN